MTLPTPTTWHPLPEGFQYAARRIALDTLASEPFERCYDVESRNAGSAFGSSPRNLSGDETAVKIAARTRPHLLPVLNSEPPPLMEVATQRHAVRGALASGAMWAARS